MATTALRHLFCKTAAAPQLGKLRSFRASGTKQFEYSNDYIHAPTMYNLTQMKGRKLKFGILVFGGVTAGILIPVFAVCFQQGKASKS